MAAFEIPNISVVGVTPNDWDSSRENQGGIIFNIEDIPDVSSN